MPKKDKKLSTFVTILSFFALLLSYSYIASIYKSYEVEIQEQNLQTDITRLQKENERMLKQLDYITTPSFIEREAKRELNLKKPGEDVLIVKSDKNLIKTEIPKEEIAWQNLSNPERWLKYFLSKD